MSSSSKPILSIVFPTMGYQEPESIKEEGRGSFKIDEKLSGKKRPAEAFSNDLPQQEKREPTANNYQK